MKIIRKTAFSLCLLLAACVGAQTAYAVPLGGESVLAGYSLTVVAGERKYVFSYPEIDCVAGETYLKNAEEVTEGIFADTVIRPTDATVAIRAERDYPFVFTAEKPGKGVDRERLAGDIARALRERKTEVKAVFLTLEPSVTAAQLKSFTSPISSFSTDYSSSSDVRKKNIELAVKYFGGRSVAPGKTLSFNDAVGARTEERGFGEAKIIVGGKYVDGTGGGVCQVSTTVYNAALTAGLAIAERHPHSLLSGYVEPSFDAMVSTGSSDLKIRNDSGDRVFVTVRCVDGKIQARVFGKKQKYVYKRVSEVLSYIDPPEEERIKSAELKKGETKVEALPKRGATSRAYLEKYLGGKLVGKTLVSEDRYSPVRGVTVEGDGD